MQQPNNFSDKEIERLRWVFKNFMPEEHAKFEKQIVGLVRKGPEAAASDPNFFSYYITSDNFVTKVDEVLQMLTNVSGALRKYREDFNFVQESLNKLATQNLEKFLEIEYSKEG